MSDSPSGAEGGGRIKRSLKALLNAMDETFQVHEEVGDTAVRERMREAIARAPPVPVPAYVLLDEFGTFEPEGDVKVKVALARLIDSARVESAGLKTPKAGCGRSRTAMWSRVTAARTASSSGTTTARTQPHDDRFGPAPDRGPELALPRHGTPVSPGAAILLDAHPDHAPACRSVRDCPWRRLSFAAGG
jgi:hypothetical protein